MKAQAQSVGINCPSSDTELEDLVNRNVLSNKVSEGWSQIAGHAGSFLKSEPGTMCKRATARERVTLPLLMKDSLAKWVPQYYGEKKNDGELYIQMQDLLYEFKNPCVMDIKMGFRTFLECEVVNEELRPDLLEKMYKLSPDDITSEEKRQGGVTKLRYMQFRENLSSTRRIGFRIEGIKTPKFSNNKTKAIGTEECVKDAIREYLSLRPKVRDTFSQMLEDIRKCIMNSEVFRTHEVVGSSLLFVYDDSKAGVWLIDFGKTQVVEGRDMTHTEMWQQGNREDGYLVGFDNLQKLFNSL
eukprot:CFRG4355T1